MARPRDFSELKEKPEVQATPSEEQTPDRLAEFLDKRAKDRLAQEIQSEYAKADQNRLDVVRRNKVKHGAWDADRLNGEDADPSDDSDNEDADNDFLAELAKHSKMHRPDMAENFVSSAVYQRSWLDWWHNDRRVAQSASLMHDSSRVLEERHLPRNERVAGRKLAGNMGLFAAGTVATGVVADAAGRFGESYVMARLGVEDGKFSGHLNSGEHALGVAGTEAAAGVGTSLVSSAYNLIPFVGAYRDIQAGDYGSAALNIVVSTAVTTSLVVGALALTGLAAPAAALIGAWTWGSAALTAGAALLPTIDIVAGTVGMAQLGWSALVGAKDAVQFAMSKKGRVEIDAFCKEIPFIGGGIKNADMVRYANELLPEQQAKLVTAEIKKRGDREILPSGSRGPSFAALRKDNKIDETLKPKHVADGSMVPIPIS